MCEAKEQGAIGQSLCNDNALLFSLQDHVVVVAGLEASTHASPPKKHRLSVLRPFQSRTP